MTWFRSTSAFLGLFTSLGTLFCCALPALFVLLGAGAAFASLTSQFPALIWIAIYKEWFFLSGAVFMILSVILRKRAENLECPIDAKSQEACTKARDWTKWIFRISLALYLIAFTFAYVLPRVMRG